MLRCPRCGQSYWAKTSINNQLINVTIPLDTNSGSIIVSDENGNTDVGPYELVKSHYLTCPRCNACHDLDAWIFAWEDPLHFLELEKEQICRCGGEVVFGVNFATAMRGANAKSVAEQTSPMACEVCGLPPTRNPLRYPTLEEIPYEPEE